MIRMDFCTANFRNYHSLKDSSRDFGPGVPLSLRTQSRFIRPRFKLADPLSLT